MSYLVLSGLKRRMNSDSTSPYATIARMLAGIGVISGASDTSMSKDLNSASDCLLPINYVPKTADGLDSVGYRPPMDTRGPHIIQCL